MAAKKITQVEAWQLRHKVRRMTEERERMLNAWATWPGGVHLGTLDEQSADVEYAMIHTSRKLGHAVVLTTATNGKKIEMYACKLPEQQ